MENKNTKTTCRYADADSYVLTCEPQESTVEPEQIAPVAETSQDNQATSATSENQAAVPAAPAMEPAQAAETVDAEQIEVPIVGDTSDSYAEPLGESTSWYPEGTSSNNVVNYQYGTTSQYTASLLRPEEGFTASDIALIVLIAASLFAVVCSVILLTGRTVAERPKRKDFLK